MNKKNFILPAMSIIAGLVILNIQAPRTEHVNGGVILGLFVLILGTIYLMISIYREIYRSGMETPFPFDMLFPDYPKVGDSDGLGRKITGFRNALTDFLGAGGIPENSDLQSHASQILWHSMSLWKQRLNRLGITVELRMDRRAWSSAKNALKSEGFFDGRFDVCDVTEEIDALRTYSCNGRALGRLRDREIAHYTILSAKKAGDDEIICPGCGNAASRSNLLDGCDYCGTKFTVEDLQDRVGSFGFRRDFSVVESRREVLTELIFPWVWLILVIPFVYFGFFGAFVYMNESIIARLITGIVAGGLLGLLAWCLVKPVMFILVPLVESISDKRGSFNRQMLFRSGAEAAKERGMAEYVRREDPKFSLQSFFGGIHNKLYAIHFAESEKQINAFSECDLSGKLSGYRDVVDIDTPHMSLDNYTVDSRIQTAVVSCELILHELRGGKLTHRRENVKMQLVKSAGILTQSVCGPSVLRCRGCGMSLSLMEGKNCHHCGRDIDMKQHDWVITGYQNR